MLATAATTNLGESFKLEYSFDPEVVGRVQSAWQADLLRHQLLVWHLQQLQDFKSVPVIQDVVNRALEPLDVVGKCWHRFTSR